jgi:hypothetical protein
MTPLRSAWRCEYRIVVRRVAIGSVRYRWGWEVREATGDARVHISPERFRDMETAYQAGKAWLGAAEPVAGAVTGKSCGRYPTRRGRRRRMKPATAVAGSGLRPLPPRAASQPIRTHQIGVGPGNGSEV